MQNSVKQLIHSCEHTALPTAALQQDPNFDSQNPVVDSFFSPFGCPFKESPLYKETKKIPHIEEQSGSLFCCQNYK